MDYAFVVPCYNEAARWDDSYWRPLLELSGIHWIFVDDGSTDGTLELLERTSTFGSAEVVHTSPNRGKAEAVRSGLRRALESSDVARRGVGFMDADGAFEPLEVARLIDVFDRRTAGTEAVDAVWSARVALAGHNIRRSRVRHFIGRAVMTLVAAGGPPIPYDTQSGLKLFVPSETLLGCLEAPFQTRWLFELELLNRWQARALAPMRIWEEPLNSWVDVPGSKIDARESLRISRELYVIKRQRSRLARAGAANGNPKQPPPKD